MLGDGEIVLIYNFVVFMQCFECEVVVCGLFDQEVMGVVVELYCDGSIDVVLGLVIQLIVMVVDDLFMVCKVMQCLFMCFGYQVVFVCDGVDVLCQLQEVMFDVMFVDIEMLYMDGFDFMCNVCVDECIGVMLIIMIILCIVDKYCCYVVEIGVNVYLGKLYNEEELFWYLCNFIGECVLVVNVG